MARAVVVDPLLAQALRADVAVAIEDGKRLAVLEHLVVGIGQLGPGLDVVARRLGVLGRDRLEERQLSRGTGPRRGRSMWSSRASLACRRGAARRVPALPTDRGVGLFAMVGVSR